jgi:radical SAM superfamily enzyme YgiQ (UPF0313 family)
MTYFCVLKDFEQILENVRPDLVAYSLNIFGFDEVVAEHKRLQSIYGFKSIAGGPQCTSFPELYSETGIDTYCIGEGELAWDEYLSRVEKGEPFDNVANLITPKGANPVRPYVEDLGTLPIADRDLVLSNSFLKETPKKTFYASRGCPFSCYYCAVSFYNALYKGKGKVIRRFPVDRIIDEIKDVGSKYRMDFLKFGDDLFALRPDDWLNAFSERYIKEINIPFNCFLRFDWVTDELIEILAKMNCYSVHLSVDSTSEKVREMVLGRKQKKVNIIEQLKMIHRHKIHTFVNFMLAAPDSTVEDDLETIEFGYKGKVTYLNYTTTTPTKGTKLYDYVTSHGMVDLTDYSQDLFGFGKPSQLIIFSQKEKDIRYNVYLLGGVASHLPNPFRWFVKMVIKHTKPNDFYMWIRKVHMKWYFEKGIFNLDE